MRVHLKVDTGMHRVGAPHGRARAARPGAAGPAGAAVGGLVDPPGPGRRARRVSTTVTQLVRLDAAIGVLQAAGYPPPLVHAANSAGALAWGPAARRDLVRAGIAVYGIPPGPEVAAECAELQPALSLRACVSTCSGCRRARASRTGTASCSTARRRSPRCPSATPTACPAGWATGAARCCSAAGAGRSRGPSPWTSSWSTAATTSSRRATRRC